MLLNKQHLMMTALLCSAALHCYADDTQNDPALGKPMPQTTVVQPPAPAPEPEGLWPMGRREEERRLTPNQTVRGRAKLYPQEDMPRRIKLGDPAQ